MKSKKLLVTGSNGLIGSEVVTFFAQIGAYYMASIIICVKTSLGRKEVHVGIKSVFKAFFLIFITMNLISEIERA
jgi:FlaA1/EpsC-like NDP-sugar epimerase